MHHLRESALLSCHCPTRFNAKNCVFVLSHYTLPLLGSPDSLRLPQRLELEIEPELDKLIEELSIRSGRSFSENTQVLNSCACSINQAETDIGEAIN